MKTKKQQSSPTVSEQSSQTPAVNGEFVQEPADIALGGDLVLMSPDELADIVIEGFRKLRPYQRYIAELHRRFTIADRDENNRLLEPIKGCHTFREFCTKRLGRTAEAVYKMMRTADPLPKPKRQPRLPGSTANADDASGSAAFPVPSTPVEVKVAYPRYADGKSTSLIDEVTHSDYDYGTQVKILRIVIGNIQAAIPEIEAEIKAAA
jgi:hypothetical protein